MTSTGQQMTVDADSFRAVMGHFATGVSVVTTCDGSQRQGITVNAFCSVSLEPPLVLVCIEKTSHVHDAMRASGVFAVNLLRADQEQFSTGFASNTEERRRDFCHVASHTVATGAPVFDVSLGFADCRVVAMYPGGDHTIFLGRVEALGAFEGEPLLYYRSHYLHDLPTSRDRPAAENERAQ
ncbi:MAG TPA: flavin reductase family protein [Ktedonobacterales bacterium]|nr:flavin reductase family protein [Ktedonobacterales bacterium]